MFRFQNPFKKPKGLVQRVLFHPLRPFLFVAVCTVHTSTRAMSVDEANISAYYIYCMFDQDSSLCTLLSQHRVGFVNYVCKQEWVAIAATVVLCWCLPPLIIELTSLVFIILCYQTVYI